MKVSYKLTLRSGRRFELHFSNAALDNINETGLDTAEMAEDVGQLLRGEVLEAQLLARCLDGADEDREQGWRDYVATIVGAAEADRGGGS